MDSNLLYPNSPDSVNGALPGAGILAPRQSTTQPTQAPGMPPSQHILGAYRNQRTATDPAPDQVIPGSDILGGAGFAKSGGGGGTAVPSNTVPTPAPGSNPLARGNGGLTTPGTGTGTGMPATGAPTGAPPGNPLLKDGSLDLTSYLNGRNPFGTVGNIDQYNPQYFLRTEASEGGQIVEALNPRVQGNGAAGVIIDGNKVQIGSFNQWQITNLLRDPSKVEYDPEFGMLTTADNIKVDTSGEWIPYALVAAGFGSAFAGYAAGGGFAGAGLGTGTGTGTGVGTGALIPGTEPIPLIPEPTPLPPIDPIIDPTFPPVTPPTVPEPTPTPTPTTPAPPITGTPTPGTPTPTTPPPTIPGTEPIPTLPDPTTTSPITNLPDPGPTPTIDPITGSPTIGTPDWLNPSNLLRLGLTGAGLAANHNATGTSGGGTGTAADTVAANKPLQDQARTTLSNNGAPTADQLKAINDAIALQRQQGREAIIQSSINSGMGGADSMVVQDKLRSFDMQLEVMREQAVMKQSEENTLTALSELGLVDQEQFALAQIQLGQSTAAQQRASSIMQELGWLWSLWK